MNDIERHIQKIDQTIKDLKEQRKDLVKARTKLRRNELTERMKELLEIIRANPGIDRYYISELMSMTTEETYMNTMTSLRRRKMIVNKGTRHNPKWYVSDQWRRVR